jgi:hypothetical protein
MRKSLFSLRKIVLALLAKKRIVVNVASNSACYAIWRLNMARFIKFLKDWQEVTDVSRRQADELARDPKFARQFNAMNWVITIAMAIGLLYAFMA